MPLNIEATLGVDANEAQARKEMDHLGDTITKALKDSLAPLGGIIEKSIGASLRKALDPKVLHGFVDGMEVATLSSRKLETEIEQLRSDSVAFEKQLEATRKTLLKSGADSNLFAGIEQQMKSVASLTRKLDAEIDQLRVDPGAVKALQLQYDTMRTNISRSVAGVQSVLKTFTSQQRQELIRQSQDANNASRERVTNTRAETSKLIVAQQHEGALVLAEQRKNNTLQINGAKATARSRIEFTRFALRQITALEKSIGAVFRGTAATVGRAFSRIENTVFRTRGVLRAENNAMTQGLQPALLSRERSISRSFHSQETTIRSSVIRQERALQQLNAQASRGVAGAVSGRSAVGGLLGGGLAFGGVFTLITKLKQGFTETVNLNEALNKTRLIFGEATADIQAFADNSVEALFVTKSEALSAAANFGIFGRSAGLVGPELATFSKDLTLLATDLASFNNTSIEDATQALSAALRGESEPIRKYGVLLNEVVLQNRALEIGVIKTIRKLQPFERVLAANAEIFAQTAVQQGDAARTANDFANSSRRARAASVEFFASIAKVAVPLATVITNSLFPAFQNLTKFVLNEVGPGLRILRDGLIGAGAALGSLLAAKAAVQVIQVLGIVAKIALTPMGLLAVALGGLGAAINILSKRSPEFRRVFDDIRESIGERLRQGLELAREVLERVGDIIVNTVVPAALDLAAVVRDRLLDAFNATVGFVRGTVIPAFERFGRFMRDVVLPAIVDTARAWREKLEPRFRELKEFLDPAIEAFGRFVTQVREAFQLAVSGDFTGLVEVLRTLRDFISPVTDAFRDLGSVIADVFSGDFGGALDRIREFGIRGAVIAGAASAAIVLAFVNPFLGIAAAIALALGGVFGPDLLKAVQPQVKRFTDFLKGVFSARNLGDVAEGFLTVVRRIGEIIGGIVTDRRFVTALAAIVAAAAATAGSFIIGFVEGVQSNLPELGRLLGGVLKKGFTEAFEFALGNPLDLLKILGGLFLVSRVLSIFSKFGEGGARGFVKGFASGLKTGAVNNAQFFRGFFGDPQQLATKFAADYSKTLKKTFQSVNRDLVRLGESPAPLLQGRNALGQFTGITDASLDEANRRLDDVRSRLGSATTAGALFRAEMREAFQGAKTAASGFVDFLRRDVQGGFKKIQGGARVFGTAIKDMFTDARASMKASGIGAGQAIGSAILSGVGAALSGQALGSATGAGGAALGLAGIISSALFAGAAVGPGPQSFVVGGLVAALGGVTAIITATKRAAEKAAAEMNEYADALRNAKTAADLFNGVGSVLEENLRDESQAVRDILGTTSFSFEGFTRQVIDGSTDARLTVNEFLRSLGPDAAGAVAQLAAHPELRTFDDIITRLSHADVFSDSFRTALHDSGFSIGDLADALDFLNDEMHEIGDQKGIEDQLAGFHAPETVKDIQDLDRGFRDLKGSIDAIALTGGGTGAVLGAALLGTQGEAGVARRLEATRTAVDAIRSAVDTLNQQRTDRITAEIETVTDQLQIARDTAQLARDAISTFFTGPTDTAQTALNDTINSIESTGNAVGEALAKPTALQEAALEVALRGFNDQVGQIATKAFEENPNLDTAGLLTQLQPLFDSIREAAGLTEEDLFTPAVGQRLIDEIQGKLTDGDFTGVVDLANSAQSAADALQEEWERLDLSLQTKISFDQEQVINAMSEVLGVSFNEAARLFGLTIRTGPFTTGFDEAGVALGPSIVEGVAEGAVAAAPKAASESMAEIGAIFRKEFEKNLGISSPSKVFKLLGIELPAGIAEGILAGTPGALAALREFSSSLVLRMVSLPGDFTDNFRNALEEIPGVLEEIPTIIEPIVEAIKEMTQATFEAVAAMESLAGADLSKLTLGAPEGANPLSNAGRVAEQFRDALQFKFNSAGSHPPGWVQTEDGSWVPPSFFAPTPLPPNPVVRSDGVNISEGAVVAAAEAAAIAAVTAVREGEVAPKVNIEHLEIVESANARLSAREAVMAMTAASLGA